MQALTKHHFSARCVVTAFYSIGAIPLVFMPTYSELTVTIYGTVWSILVLWIGLYAVSAFLTIGSVRFKTSPDGGIIISNENFNKLPEVHFDKQELDLELEK